MAGNVIKLAAIRMGDLVHTSPGQGQAQPGQAGYVPPHLRGKTVEVPKFTQDEFPSMGTTKKKAPVGGGDYLSISKKEGGVNFKEMMKVQEEKENEKKREREASENDERQQMIKDGWVFLPLSDAKAIIQRW
jgi:hypothetical protein